jgi:hypothetical protein
MTYGNNNYLFFGGPNGDFAWFDPHTTAEFTALGHTFWNTPQYILFVKAGKYGGTNLEMTIVNIIKGDNATIKTLDEHIPVPVADVNMWNDMVKEAVNLGLLPFSNSEITP